MTLAFDNRPLRRISECRQQHSSTPYFQQFSAARDRCGPHPLIKLKISHDMRPHSAARDRCGPHPLIKLKISHDMRPHSAAHDRCGPHPLIKLKISVWTHAY